MTQNARYLYIVVIISFLELGDVSMSLVELVKENVGLKCFDVRMLLERMMKEGRLKAYIAPEGEIFFKELKTATKIDEYQPPTIIEESKTGNKYVITMHSEGGMFSNDGDSQTIYHKTILEKLSPGFSPSKVERAFYGKRFYVPEDKIVAKLEISKSDDWESSGETDYIEKSRGQTVILGQKDALFEAILEYAKSRDR